MGRLVDQAVAPRADETGDASAHDAVAEDETGSEDIESELYSSTREAGISAIAFSPPDDDGSD
jgi:hypothetical protein